MNLRTTWSTYLRAPMSHINILPDEILLSILRRFSYKNQYRLGLVCCKWYGCIHMTDIKYTDTWRVYGSPIDDMLEHWGQLRGAMLARMVICTFSELMATRAYYRFMTDPTFCRAIDRRCARYYGRIAEADVCIERFYEIFDGRSHPPSMGLMACCIIL